MRMADCTPEQFEAIRQARHRRSLGNPPTGGAWWADAAVCAVCACSCVTVLDHCHITGLSRGHLCHACNLEEAFQDGPLWDLWRLTAPMLSVRQTYVTSAGYRPRRSAHLADAEIAHLPMAELLRLHDERRCTEKCSPELDAALVGIGLMLS